MYTRPGNEAVQRYKAGLLSAVHHPLDAEAELSRNQLAHQLQGRTYSMLCFCSSNDPCARRPLLHFPHSIGYKADWARYSLLLCTTV